jgi:acyl-CoA thioesterase
MRSGNPNGSRTRRENEGEGMLREIKTFFESKDRLAKLLGFEIVEVGEGYAEVKVEIREDHLNGAEVIHGGLLFSLADFAFAIASNSGNDLSLSIHSDIVFHKAVSGGTVSAVAREIKGGRTIASYEAKVRDHRGELLATFTGTVFRKGTKLLG